MRVRYLSDLKSLSQTMFRSVATFCIYWLMFTYIGFLGLLVIVVMLTVGVELLMQAAGRDGKIVLANRRRGHWTVFHGSRQTVRELSVAMETEQIASQMEVIYRTRSQQ